MIIHDKVARGALAGVAATVPQLAVDAISVAIGFSRFYGLQISAGVYLLKHLTTTFWGILFGWLVWEFMAVALGVVVSFFIQWTGKSHYWLKGLLVSNTIMFIFIYGFFYALGGPKIIPWDLGTNWTVLISNLVFGLVSSYLVVRWSPNASRTP